MREFVEKAFGFIGRPIEWQGQGVDEKGIDAKTAAYSIEIDPRYFRPTEVETAGGRPEQGAAEARLATQGLVRSSWCAKWSRPIWPRCAATARTATCRIEAAHEHSCEHGSRHIRAQRQARFRGRSCRHGGIGHRAALEHEACDIISAPRKELDLRNSEQVDRFMAQAKPDAVFVAAGKVGGIRANSTFPAEFIADNLAIALNTIRAAHRCDVKKLVYLGSSCIYPRRRRSRCSRKCC